MKKARFYLVLSVFLAFSCVLWAQEPSLPPAQTDGEAVQAVYRAHGDDIVGGSSGGDAFGNYKAESPTEALGAATADGVAKGTETVGPERSAQSESSGITSSSANANGNKNTINIHGFSNEGVWAGVTGVTNGDKNFANGSGYSSSGHDSSLASGSNLTGMGLDKSTGTVYVFNTETNTPTSSTRGANAVLALGSAATTDVPTGKTSGNGTGAAGVQSLMNGDRYSAVGFGDARVRYDGVGLTSVNAAANIDTASKVEVLPDSIHASAATSSNSKIITNGSTPPQ